MQEVGDLHVELVRRRDAADAQAAKLQGLLRKSENEANNLKFLLQQHVQRAKALEAESNVCVYAVYDGGC